VASRPASEMTDRACWHRTAIALHSLFQHDRRYSSLVRFVAVTVAGFGVWWASMVAGFMVSLYGLVHAVAKRRCLLWLFIALFPMARASPHGRRPARGDPERRGDGCCPQSNCRVDDNPFGTLKSGHSKGTVPAGTSRVAREISL